MRGGGAYDEGMLLRRAFAALVVVVFALQTGCGDETTVISGACERARDVLVACCRDQTLAALQCTSVTTHGIWTSSEDSTGPAIDDTEAACVESMSCDDLRANGVCDAARSAYPSRHSSDDGDDVSTPGAPFCTELASSVPPVKRKSPVEPPDGG